MIIALYLLIVFVLLMLSRQDYKSKEVSSMPLVFLVIFSTILSFIDNYSFENMKTGFFLVGVFVILELLTTTFIQEVAAKIFRSEELGNAVFISNGDFPLIFVFGAIFGMPLALFGIWLTFVLIAISGIIIKIIESINHTKNDELLTIPAIPYFSIVFLVLVVMKYFGFLYIIDNILKLLGYSL